MSVNTKKVTRLINVDHSSFASRSHSLLIYTSPVCCMLPRKIVPGRIRLRTTLINSIIGLIESNLDQLLSKCGVGKSCPLHLKSKKCEKSVNLKNFFAVCY